jgi:hypothetical protein
MISLLLFSESADKLPTGARGVAEGVEPVEPEDNDLVEVEGADPASLPEVEEP